MKPEMEQSRSAWMEMHQVPQRPGLDRDITADVVIVGGGIAGLSTAYFLSREGAKVAVLERRYTTSGQTQRTTAHLSYALDDYYSELEESHGVEGSQRVADSHRTAILQIEEIVHDLGIDCQFERLPGYLFCAPGHSQEFLEKELAAAHRAGLSGVALRQSTPITGFETGPALYYPNQAQFDPLAYLIRLAEEIERLGGRIYDQTHAEKITGGKEAKVTTRNGPTVTAKDVVVATNSPINNRLAIHTKVAPYLTYAIGVEVPRGAVTKALYWDTLEAYHYVRLQSLDQQSDLLIVGGEDHKAGQVADQTERCGRLEQWTRERFPSAKKVLHRWSGMVMETPDGCAFIGPNPSDKENVYIATGDSGMGLTHGTIAGILLTDLIQGRENPWAASYDPSRVPTSGEAWKHFTAENANVAKQYAGDWFSGGDHIDIEDIPSDSGALTRSGLSKVANYRGEDGELHRMSAVCPHLGCIVHWNDMEKVWDCPCHGSRFDGRGQVVNGPAISGLESLDDDDQGHPAASGARASASAPPKQE